MPVKTASPSQSVLSPTVWLSLIVLFARLKETIRHVPSASLTAKEKLLASSWKTDRA